MFENCGGIPKPFLLTFLDCLPIQTVRWVGRISVQLYIFYLCLQIPVVFNGVFQVGWGKKLGQKYYTFCFTLKTAFRENHVSSALYKKNNSKAMVLEYNIRINRIPSLIVDNLWCSFV